MISHLLEDPIQIQSSEVSLHKHYTLKLHPLFNMAPIFSGCTL